jgi:glutathione synthase/RimK-type ligase-like ATP-grasp enzyme
LAAEIGVMAGCEGPFPKALVKAVNDMKIDGIRAELCIVPEADLDYIAPYKLIVDRISHVIPFYRHLLKQAMLAGVYVINNPFRTFDDKFFSYAVAKKLGLNVPRTLLLRQSQFIPGLNEEHMFNLVKYEWDEIIDYIKLPAIIKPADGYGGHQVRVVNTSGELLEAHEKSGKRVMLLQEKIEYDQYCRCYVAGKKYVKPLKYDHYVPFEERYVVDDNFLSADLKEKVTEYAIKLSTVLDLDMNACEFAIMDGVIYAIDFTNYVPDAKPASVRYQNFQWFVDHMAKASIEYVQNPRQIQSWQSMLPLIGDNHAED